MRQPPPCNSSMRCLFLSPSVKPLAWPCTKQKSPSGAVVTWTSQTSKSTTSASIHLRRSRSKTSLPAPMTLAGAPGPQPVLRAKSLPVPKGMCPMATRRMSTPVSMSSESAQTTAPSPPATMTLMGTSASTASLRLFTSKKPGFLPLQPSRRLKPRSSTRPRQPPRSSSRGPPGAASAWRYAVAPPPPAVGFTKTKTRAGASRSSSAAMGLRPGAARGARASGLPSRAGP
mmetsp:Transcript_74517/g.240955  ORF Transcript_74517/g.240955 Transcript_74517/m.240955 type:complete len:230 (+) Transcript_74517:1129-1818(+)